MSLQQIILDDALGYWQKGYPSYTMILVMPAEIQTALVSFRRIYLTTLLSRRCPEHGQGDRTKKLYILHTHTHIYTHTKYNGSTDVSGREYFNFTYIIPQVSVLFH